MIGDKTGSQGRPAKHRIPSQLFVILVEALFISNDVIKLRLQVYLNNKCKHITCI